jgi:PhnB protein
MGARIEPWLAVSDGRKAVEYYRAGLGRRRLSSGGARKSDGSALGRRRSDVLGPIGWRLREVPNWQACTVATMDAPDPWLRRAIAEGAREVVPVTEAHGWRTGRVSDPFGHDWEFSRPAQPGEAS